jgi:hypothetical protein
MSDYNPLRLDFWVEVDKGFVKEKGYDEGLRVLNKELDSLIPAMRRRAEAVLHAFLQDEYLRTEPGLQALSPTD